MPASTRPSPFTALAASLRASGFVEQAARLEDVLTTSWTTSSELYGELGLAVLAARRECRPLSAAQKTLIRQCLRQVRTAWPTFGWFSWLPFRR